LQSQLERRSGSLVSHSQTTRTRQPCLFRARWTRLSRSRFARNFGFPVVALRLGHRRLRAPRMAVPKASMNEEDCFVFRECKIRFSRQILAVEPVPQTERICLLPDTELGTSIRTSHSRHQPGATRSGQPVDQRTTPPPLGRRSVGPFSLRSARTTASKVPVDLTRKPKTSRKVPDVIVDVERL
jgi:hypothetical protein